MMRPPRITRKVFPDGPRHWIQADSVPRSRTICDSKFIRTINYDQKRPLVECSRQNHHKSQTAGGVTVGLRRPNTTSEVFGGRATTDQEENYRIANIPAGAYEVITAAPSYVQTDPNPGNKTIFINEGENVECIDFALFIVSLQQPPSQLRGAEGSQARNSRLNSALLDCAGGLHILTL